MPAPILPIQSDEALDQAATCLKAGEFVVVPTDTIYGIAAHPDQEDVIARLYHLRQRMPEPALPFLLADIERLSALTRPNTNALRLAQRFWPGPLSLILPPSADLPPAFRAYPIAVRVPNFAPLLTLLDRAGGFLLVTGAILPGYSPAISAQEAAMLFGEQTTMILDGDPLPYGVPSTIVDCVPASPAVVRHGVIPETRIQQTLGIG
jgi:L-threonylcarbamoyladenylate synthase